MRPVHTARKKIPNWMSNVSYGIGLTLLVIFVLLFLSCLPTVISELTFDFLRIIFEILGSNY